MRIFVICSSLVLCAACGGVDGGTGETEATEAVAIKSVSFDVAFNTCTEFAGIGLVSAAKARALVPPSFTLAGDATNAQIVVRVADCADAVVDGHDVGATRVAQIGISLVGPDATASINNYTLSFSTDQPLLHAKLTAAGVDADLAHTLDFALTPSGSLVIASSSPHTPDFTVTGSAAPPVADPVPFIATWWANGHHGSVESRTVLPAIRFGSSQTTLHTPAQSSLAALIGGTSLTFPLLDSYNSFPSASMHVSN